MQTQSPIPAPRGRICDNADSSVRTSSFLFCNQQVRRISRKSPSRRHDGQVLADHDTWSNPQLQALVQTHARLIQEYRCVERQLQGPAPAAPVVDQGPHRNRLHKACGCWIKGESRQQCDRFTIDEFGDHIHSCTQHAGATTSSHEHILTAVQPGGLRNRVQKRAT
jgi:hypothetical protein